MSKINVHVLTINKYNNKYEFHDFPCMTTYSEKLAVFLGYDS